MTAIAPPPRRLMLREARVLVNLAQALPRALGVAASLPANAPAVIVLPGFGSSDRATWPLRRHLRQQGFAAEGWGLGTNRAGLNLPHSQDDLDPRWNIDRRDDYHGEASVPYLCDRITAHVQARTEQIGRPVALVGWSLGGYVAREAARMLPERVSQVVTMGSPVIGGPKYTAAAPLFRKRGMDMDWIEREIAKQDARPIQQPILAIVSRSDAVVSWAAAQDQVSPNVTHVEIDAAHLGMGFNPKIWQLVVERLRSA
ncbi:alpha/beta fold hydrolase [bacterium]|nr:alpha/beta fold hydrolase [bacterium]